MIRKEDEIRTTIALIKARCDMAEEELHKRLFDKLYQPTDLIHTNDLQECIRFMKVELKILRWFIYEDVFYF